MSDPTSITSALAPGVALTSAVIYWANLQGRLDTISGRVRGLNAELRGSVAGTPRTVSIERQIGMLSRRLRVLHKGVVLSVVTLIAFLVSSAVLFVFAPTFPPRQAMAEALFLLGLATFGGSLGTMLWEMLWSRLSLEEDIAGSRPRPPAA
ncbi:MAG TPA: DUF2721 domain-containing protein [Polyangia bacterium]|nr:DUF2721 domain-containing protein [Polyangia bacterium]